MADTSLLDGIDDATPIGSCLRGWHQLFEGRADALDQVLADDVVLHSPVLFTPVTGKEIVGLYLTGAFMTFVQRAEATDGAAVADDGWDGSFRYVRVVTGPRDAVLEFETTMAGKYVNGVDMITCDDGGRIVDFKVMVRPMRAVEAVREMMGAALETLQSGDTPASAR